jgi:uncharacterized protein YbjT (DUF2867 family)
MIAVVVGGTGLVGSKLVARLRDHGAEVRVATRRTGVNAYTGQGLAEAVNGADVVIDVTNVSWSPYDDEPTAAFFETCTTNILWAGQRFGVAHHVMLSALGAHRIDSPYFRSKAAQERLVLAATTPHSVLRTTVLHETLPLLVERASTTHAVHLPPVRVQPVAATDVVSRLCRLALDAPINGAFEIAGPEIHFLDELARQVLEAGSDRRPVVADGNARYLDAVLDPDSETLLPRWRQSRTSFRDWLAGAGPAEARSGPAA